MNSHEHRSFELVKLITNPDKQGRRALLRAAIGDSVTHTMSGTIPDVGEIVNVPTINLDDKTILIIGNNYIAILAEPCEVLDDSNS